MEWREFGREDVRSGVEDVFGARMQVLVPYLQQAIRFVGGSGVFRIGGQNKLWEL